MPAFAVSVAGRNTGGETGFNRRELRFGGIIGSIAMFTSAQTLRTQRLSCPHDNARFTEQQAARLCVHCQEPFLPRACQIVRCSNCGTEATEGARNCLCAGARLQVAGYRCPSCLQEGAEEMLDAPPACPYCFTVVEDPEAAPPKLPRWAVAAAPVVFAPKILPSQEPIAHETDPLIVPPAPAPALLAQPVQATNPEAASPIAPPEQTAAPEASSLIVPSAAPLSLPPLSETPEPRTVALMAPPVQAAASQPASFIVPPAQASVFQPVSAVAPPPQALLREVSPSGASGRKHPGSFKRFIPVAAFLLGAAVAVAAGYKYVPQMVEHVLRSLGSPAPKQASPNDAPTGEGRPVAQKPHPGVPAEPVSLPEASQVPGVPGPTAQTQPAEAANPAAAPAKNPAGSTVPAAAPAAIPSAPPSPAAGQPNQPAQPVSPAAAVKSPVIVAFTTSAQSIERGSSATLHWEVTGDNPTVTLLPGIGAVPATGSWNVKPATTQQFTLEAANSGPSSPQLRSITIVVAQAQTPKIVSFTADSSQVRLGQTVLLRWTVSGASQVRIDPGIGTVGASGTAVIRPLSNTAYTLSAFGDGGTTKGSVSIGVLGAPLAAAPFVPVQGPAAPSRTQFSPVEKDAAALKDPAALRLLALVQVAMGGKRNLEAIHDWQRMERVTWEVNGGTSYETTTFVAPSAIRVESQGGNTIVDFSNGDAGWTWSSARPERSNLPYAIATGAPFRSLPQLLLSDDDPARSVTLAGPATLVIADSHNDRVWLRVDPATRLPQSIAWINADGSAWQENYSNWRPVAGVMWWFQMTRTRNRQEFLHADAAGVRVNQGWTAQRVASANP
jgi:hypothetical protein